MEKATQDKAALSMKKYMIKLKYFMYSVYIQHLLRVKLIPELISSPRQLFLPAAGKMLCQT